MPQKSLSIWSSPLQVLFLSAAQLLFLMKQMITYLLRRSRTLLALGLLLSVYAIASQTQGPHQVVLSDILNHNY
jgi:hypothetical protein